jgi:hypothetical protein
VLLVPNGEYTPAPLVRRDAKALLAELNVQILRFRAIDIDRLIAALELPPVMTAKQGTKTDWQIKASLCGKRGYFWRGAQRPKNSE